MKYKIALNNISKLKHVLDQVFKWNMNKDIVLFSFKGEQHKFHFRVIHPLSYGHENESIDFNIKSYYSNAKFNNLIKNEGIEQSNIIMTTHYIEDISSDYLIVKKDNLSNYNFNVDKEVVVFELHTKLLSNNILFNYLDKTMTDYIYYTDFNTLLQDTNVISINFNLNKR